jgi:hypothetical protein
MRLTLLAAKRRLAIASYPTTSGTTFVIWAQAKFRYFDYALPSFAN